MRSLLGTFVPAELQEDSEGARRAQLVVLFSLVGLVFGLLFAAFYFWIGHIWGAAIVLACTIALADGPWMLRRLGLERAVNFYALVLVLGFSGLTAIEGGLHGHAVAWLAVLPLCTSILVGDRTCVRWSAVCLACMLVFSFIDLSGHKLAPWYPQAWERIITMAGFLSLTIFMSAVGILYEQGRRRSLEKLQRTMAALSSANEQLKALNQERSEFLGIAAHDLRQPLNAIVGFAQLIQLYGGPMSTAQGDSINRILVASTRMRELLDRLLSVRAIEEGRLEVIPEPCDLTELAGTLAENHQMAASAKQISLSFLPMPGAAWAMADPAAVAQILDNLLSNAIKFSPPGRGVILRVTHIESEKRAAIEVQDSGPGLSEEDQAKLYGKFARLSAQPTAGESSTGLGLSIAKRLAQLMQGDLVCRSRVGEGATFSLLLPMASPQAEPSVSPEETPLEPVPDFLKASFREDFKPAAIRS